MISSLTYSIPGCIWVVTSFLVQLYLNFVKVEPHGSWAVLILNQDDNCFTELQETIQFSSRQKSQPTQQRNLLQHCVNHSILALFYLSTLIRNVIRWSLYWLLDVPTWAKLSANNIFPDCSVVFSSFLYSFPTESFLAFCIFL